jgi:hypothetical protein
VAGSSVDPSRLVRPAQIAASSALNKNGKLDAAGNLNLAAIAIGLDGLPGHLPAGTAA